MPAVTDADLAAVSHLLEPGEDVRWAGQPDAPRAALGSLPVSFFGTFFGGFALFWMAAASGFTFSLNGPAGLFPFFGLPFFLVGLALVLSPLYAWRSARRTLYVVTDRRALIATPGAGGLTIRTLRPEELADATLTVGRAGRGSIQFGRRPSPSGDPTPKPALFAGIDDVLRVKALLDGLRRAPLLPLPPGDDTADLDAGDEASDARMPEPPAWNLTGRSRP